MRLSSVQIGEGGSKSSTLISVSPTRRIQNISRDNDTYLYIHQQMTDAMVDLNLDGLDMTFRPNAIVRIADGLDTDDENYVTKDGERLTDGLGVPIRKDDVGGLIPLKRHNFHVNDEGIVVNENEEPVWILSDGERRDLFVPTTHREEPAAIIRQDYPNKSAIISLVEQSQEFLK